MANTEEYKAPFRLYHQCVDCNYMVVGLKAWPDVCPQCGMAKYEDVAAQRITTLANWPWSLRGAMYPTVVSSVLRTRGGEELHQRYTSGVDWHDG